MSVNCLFKILMFLMFTRDNPSDRIGHGSTNLKEVRKHKWLNNFNWDALKARKLNAPFILPVRAFIEMNMPIPVLCGMDNIINLRHDVIKIKNICLLLIINAIIAVLLRNRINIMFECFMYVL